MRHRIPREPIVKVIKQYLIDHPTESYEAMSEGMGFNKSYIRALLTGVRKDKVYETMEFNTADKILCKLNKYDLWYEKPLNKYYWPEGEPPDHSKPEPCAREGCNEWFELTPNAISGGQKYCSAQCRWYANQSTWRKTEKGREHHNKKMQEYYARNRERIKERMKEHRAKKKAEAIASET